MSCQNINEKIMNFITCPGILIDKYRRIDYTYILNLIDDNIEKRNDGCREYIIKDLLSNFLFFIYIILLKVT
jgi:hypothetical protein